MGQKVNPLGFRIGISRKWNSSWYYPSFVQKSFDSAQANEILLKKGVITARGGFFLSSLEERFRNFFRRYRYISKNRSRRFLPINIQYRKGAQLHMFFFLTYRKLQGRRKTKKTIGRIKKLISLFNENSNL